MRTMAERYLSSDLPGPGVRERGIELMEELAAGGDATARDDLAELLRTGDRGVDRDLDAAKGWLIQAAESGDSQAMERAAENYMHGREGCA
jgi:TPR repeat protein